MESLASRCVLFQDRSVVSKSCFGVDNKAPSRPRSAQSNSISARFANQRYTCRISQAFVTSSLLRISSEAYSTPGRDSGRHVARATDTEVSQSIQEQTESAAARPASRKKKQKKGKKGKRAGIVEAETEVEVEAETDADATTSAEQGPPKTSGKSLQKSKMPSGSSTVSSGVRLEGIQKSFKSVPVLKDVTWEVKKGERVGLVGHNGAGKTTQLKIITGELEPDAGAVVKPKNCQVAYLTQEFEVEETRTVRAEFMSVFQDKFDAQKRLQELEQELAEVGEDMVRMQAILDEMEAQQQEEGKVDMFEVEKRIEIMMKEMGFKQEDSERLVSTYSGGWQMRMCLGKILLQEPDLLLLDEPTNHLDLDSVEWLEKYLCTQSVPMVVVSHDRAFLDQLCTKIVSTDRGVSSSWQGNYSSHLQQKAAATSVQLAAYNRQQKEIQRLREMVGRLSGGGQSGRAAAAEKELERMREEGLVQKPWVDKARKLRFPLKEQSGRVVAEVKGLTHGYTEGPLFEDGNLLVERGERVAIVGPNGAGKSTFVRLLLGQEEAQGGSVTMGEYNVLPNYFQQNQAEALDPGLTAMETLVEAAADWNEDDIKSLLGRMMFKGDEMFKRVSVLSGGEKARLALAKFIVSPATFLILDEPTNHLDIASKEMLEEALQNFDGTVVAISHDRYFLRQIATRVVEIRNKTFSTYTGNYQYYLEQNTDAAAREERYVKKEKEVAKDQVKAKSKMSKAEKLAAKKAKAKSFGQGNAKRSKNKNAGRWN